MHCLFATYVDDVHSWLDGSVFQFTLPMEAEGGDE